MPSLTARLLFVHTLFRIQLSAVDLFLCLLSLTPASTSKSLCILTSTPCCTYHTACCCTQLHQDCCQLRCFSLECATPIYVLHVRTRLYILITFCFHVSPFSASPRLPHSTLHTSLVMLFARFRHNAMSCCCRLPSLAL